MVRYRSSTLVFGEARSVERRNQPPVPYNEQSRITHLNSLERIHRTSVIAYESEQSTTGKGCDNDRFEYGKDLGNRLKDIS